MKKITLLLIAFFFIFSGKAQVGIGTEDPKAQLDIISTNAGLLLPRVDLDSKTDITTVTRPNATGIEVSTMVYNTGTGDLLPAGFYYWDGSSWVQMITTGQQVHVGKFRVQNAGNLNITGLPFEPKRIVFKAYSNAYSYFNNSDNSVGNSDNGIRNYFGFMSGFAQNNSGTIEQQVIAGGGSANSITNLSRYASDSNCIGMRYSDKNGIFLALTKASLTSFNTDGFTINITKPDSAGSNLGELVILYTAYKY